MDSLRKGYVRPVRCVQEVSVLYCHTHRYSCPLALVKTMQEVPHKWINTTKKLCIHPNQNSQQHRKANGYGWHEHRLLLLVRGTEDREHQVGSDQHLHNQTLPRADIRAHHSCGQSLRKLRRCYPTTKQALTQRHAKELFCFFLIVAFT